MSFKVRTIQPFEKETKRLAKKFPSLKADLRNLIESIQLNPTQGTSLGNGFYKIRMAISSKGTGKSGGARIITYVKIVDEIVYLTFIYDKSERATISDQYLKELSQIIEQL